MKLSTALRRKALPLIMKSFLCMRRKNLQWMSLILLLTLSVSMVSVVKAEGTVLSVEPRYTVEPGLGDTFLVDIKVTNVTDLWCLEFELWYDSTFINATDVTPGPVWRPGDFVIAEKNHTVPGLVKYGLSFFATPSFSGTGVVATINFTGLAINISPLHINETIIGDSSIPSQPIQHTTEDAEVKVVPEFPAALIIPVLLIATLAATLVGKMAWSRKRKDALTAE